MARKVTTETASETERRAFVYARVSTSEQADSGLGLEAQQARCEAYAVAQGWTVGGIFVDAGVSAKTLDRPELKRALDELRAGDVLIVFKLDRLTRTVADLAPLAERIEAAGADWCSVSERFDTSTATGRLMLSMAVVLSQWEREQTGERTAAALGAKRTRGERLGTTPLGFVTVGGTVEVDHEGAATVTRARELKAAGHTLREIAAVLTDEGRRPKRGGQWFASNVRSIIAPKYVEAIKGGAA